MTRTLSCGTWNSDPKLHLFIRGCPVDVEICVGVVNPAVATQKAFADVFQRPAGLLDHEVLFP